MHHTTGLTTAEILDLCGLVRRETADARENVWPPILGLFKAVVVTLTYLRRNRVQAELAETFGVSQPTISRAISGLTPVLGRVLSDYVPVAEDLFPLFRCWCEETRQPAPRRVVHIPTCPGDFLLCRQATSLVMVELGPKGDGGHEKGRRWRITGRHMDMQTSTRPSVSPSARVSG